MKIKNLLTATAVILSINTFAATSPTSATSTASPASAGVPFSKKITIGYFGQLSTTSIGSPSRYVPDNFNAKGSDTINLYNSLAVGYKFNDELVLKLANRFEYRPVGTIAAAGIGLNPENKNSMDLHLLNHRIILEKANIINSNGFNTKAGAFLEVPTETAARESSRLIVSPRLYIGNAYNLPNSRWSFGLNANIQSYYYSIDKGQKNFEAYLNPNLSYKINSKLSATGEYEASAAHSRKDGLSSNWNQDGTDIHLGVAYDITPDLSINPYIQLQPGGRVNLDTSSIGMYIAGTIL